MSRLRVRPLKISDISHLVRYWREGTDEFYKTMGVDPAKLPCALDLEALLKSEVEATTPRYLIGTVDGRPVGCGLLSFSNAGEEPEFHFHIWDASDRSRGYARHFVHKMLPRFAGIYGLPSILLQPAEGNQAAVLGLEKEGFRDAGATERVASSFYTGGRARRFAFDSSYPRTLWASVKSYLNVILLTIIAGYAAKTYQLVDQAFASRISSLHLEAHVLISYIPFVVGFFAMILGYALLVLLNKSPTQEERGRYLTGALRITLVSGIATAILLISRASSAVDLLGISEVRGAYDYIRLQSLAAVLVGVNTVYKYACIAQKKSHLFLIVDGVGTVLNILGNWLAVTLIASKAGAFAGLAWTTLVVQLISFGIYYANLRSPVGNKHGMVGLFWARAKNLVLGETASILLFMGIPIVYTYLFRRLSDDSVMSAYNVAYHVVAFISVPLYALNATGTAWLSAAWQFGSRRMWMVRLQSLLVLGFFLLIIPVLAILPFTSEFLSFFFRIEGKLEAWVVAVILVTLIPSTLVLPYSCAIRVFENPKLLAFSVFFGSYVFGIPAFVLLSEMSYLQAAILVSQLGSVLISCGMTFYFLAKLYRKHQVFR